MTRCSCYYEGDKDSDCIRRDNDPKCEVHGERSK